MRHVLTLVALLATGCATVPLNLDNGGGPLAQSGWQVSGGADFEPPPGHDHAGNAARHLHAPRAI